MHLLNSARQHLVCVPVVHEVAAAIGCVRLDQRDVGSERELHDVRYAVEFAHLFTLGHQGAHTRLGEERRNAGTTGA